MDSYSVQVGEKNKSVLKGNDLAQLHRSFQCLPVVVRRLDLFTMQHAQHHKSGIAWLLSGITGVVSEFSIKLLYRKTIKKKKKTPHQPLVRKGHLIHTFAGHTSISMKGLFPPILSKNAAFSS